MKNNLPDWIRAQLFKRDWSQNKLADKTNLSKSELSRIMNGKKPSIEVGKAIADVLHVSEPTVFIESGQFRKPPAYNSKADELQTHFSLMMDDDQEEMLHVARMKIERRNRGSNGKKNADQT